MLHHADSLQSQLHDRFSTRKLHALSNEVQSPTAEKMLAPHPRVIRECQKPFFRQGKREEQSEASAERDAKRPRLEAAEEIELSRGSSGNQTAQSRESDGGLVPFDEESGRMDWT